MPGEGPESRSSSRGCKVRAGHARGSVGGQVFRGVLSSNKKLAQTLVYTCLYLTVYTLVLTSGRTAVFLTGFANQFWEFCFDIFIDPPLELTTVSRSQFHVEYDATHEILI